MSGEKRGDPARILSYLDDMAFGQLEPESTILRYAFVAIMLTLVGSLSYGLTEGAIGIPLELTVLGFFSAILCVSSITHMEAYQEKMCCVNGMMVGMTIGMVAGFLSGALLGAANGMFIGSVMGSLLGIAFGVAVGRFSGIMGAMEGMMAGLMSGTMGAMLSVMMINDNLMAFLVLLFGACLLILGGLSYMIRREAGTAPEGKRPGLGGFMALTLGLGTLLALIMIYGPRGPITAW